MLHCKIIDMSEGIDLTKSNKSKRMHDMPLLFFLSLIQISRFCM